MSRNAAPGGSTISTAVTKESSRDQRHHGNSNLVHLIVGGYTYTTTPDVLLSSPFCFGEDNYFHSLLSRRGNRTGLPNPIKIPDMDGRVFFYVLLFLKVGDLPRGANTAAHRSLLPREDLDELEVQAGVFGLARLVELCKSTNVLKGVTPPGDLDLAPFGGFSVEILDHRGLLEPEFLFKMRYVYKGARMVQAFGALDKYGYNHIYVYTTKKRGRFEYTKGIVDDHSFRQTFERLRKLIEDAHTEKSSADEELSVTHVLDQTGVKPEERLWYGFVVKGMICHYEKYNYIDSRIGVGILFSDTSSFVEMKTVGLKEDYNLDLKQLREEDDSDSSSSYSSGGGDDGNF